MNHLNITLVNLWPEGGMLHYIAQLSTTLAKQEKLKITVLLPKGTDSKLFSSDTQLIYTDIPTNVTLLNILKLVCGLSFLNLYRTIASTKPDVIHLNSSHPLLIAVLPLLARKYNIVATIHDATSHPGSDKNIRKHLERQVIIRHAKKIFVHRDIIRKKLLELNPSIDKKHVLVTPHGDYNFFNTISANFTEETETLLFFGRISLYKGLKYLVEAVTIIKSKYPNLKVIIAGSGDPGQQVQQALNDDIYEVHNRFISDDEVASFFNRANILVLPYIEASESGVIQIGKAFAKPIISTRVGGIPEAVRDKVTGLIVSPGNTDELANALDTLLSDKILREKIKLNIRNESKKSPGWNEASSIITDVYKAITKEQASRPPAR